MTHLEHLPPATDARTWDRLYKLAIARGIGCEYDALPCCACGGCREWRLLLHTEMKLVRSSKARNTSCVSWQRERSLARPSM